MAIKPTPKQILNEPAGPRLDAWFARYVMIWESESCYRGMTTKEDMWWMENGFAKIELAKWSPSTNIAHAMEGMEIWKKERQNDALSIIIVKMIKLPGFPKFTSGSRNIIENFLIWLSPLNLTRALLLWAVEKENG